MLEMYEIGNKLKNVKGILPYTFVNSTLQMYTSSRAEGEAIVLTANDFLTTSERQTCRMAHNECAPPRTGHNDDRKATANADASPPKAETPRGETEA